MESKRKGGNASSEVPGSDDAVTFKLTRSIVRMMSHLSIKCPLLGQCKRFARTTAA